jgi:hypothetical protein
MAGLVPAIHAFVCRQDMDTRHAPGMTAFGLGVRASRYFGFNCRTAPALQTCVIAPIVCGAGAPSSVAFPPPCERACGTPGARCTLGPDADAVFRNLECIRTFGGAEPVPDVPPAVFFRLLVLCLDERSDRELKSQGDGKGASSDWAERVLTWSSVTLSRLLSIRRSAVSLPVAVLAQIRPARRQTSPPNRVTPHLRRPPHPTPRT